MPISFYLYGYLRAGIEQTKGLENVTVFRWRRAVRQLADAENRGFSERSLSLSKASSSIPARVKNRGSPIERTASFSSRSIRTCPCYKDETCLPAGWSLCSVSLG